MRKILFAIVILLLLAACAAQQPVAPSEPARPAAPSEPVKTPEAAPSAPEAPVEEKQRIDTMPDVPEKKGEMAEHQSSDLYKAFVEGMMLCNYKLDEVLVRAWIYTEDRFRIETAVPGTRVSTVYDKDMVHSWDDRTKNGIRMKIADLPSKAGERVAGMEIPRTPEQVKSDTVDVVCVPSTAIGEDILDVAGNVEFTDVTGVVSE